MDDPVLSDAPMLLDRIAAAVDRHPDRAALVMGEAVLTHTDVERQAAIIARGLVGAGLGRGTRVAVLSPNHIRVLVATLGIIGSGATWIPLNPRDSVESVAGLCRRFGVDLLIHHPDFEPALEQVRAVSPATSVGLPLVAEGDDLLAWAEARDRGTALAVPDADQLVAVFATGGTTGVPRGVCYSYRVLSAIAGNYVEMLDHPDPVFLAAAPLTHVSGRVALGVMAAGGTTVVLPRFDPAAVLEMIERHRITTMMLPTTLLARLLAHPAARATDVSSLKRVSVGASPVPVELIKQAIDVLGPVIAQNYGQTEAPMYIATMHPDEYLIDGALVPDERLSSCGRPTRFCQVRTVGPDGGDVAAGEPGEIVVRGNFVMDGYLDDDAANAASRLDDWHRTGDLGTFDDDGYLRIVGRLKDLIISGGFNVYPAEVENVLAELPCVHESAVIGLPDPDWGERVVAVIETTDGEPCDIEQLTGHVRARLGAVKTPKDVITVASLPRNANGKILKHVLVAELGSRSQPTAG